jgi:hypothetical protein
LIWQIIGACFSILDQASNKILSPDQLAEVTKLLNQVKGQGQAQPSNPHVMELLELLKHAQPNTGNHPEQRKGTRAPPGSHGDRHRGAGIRRNVQFNPGKVCVKLFDLFQYY